VASRGFLEVTLWELVGEGDIDWVGDFTGSDRATPQFTPVVCGQTS